MGIISQWEMPIYFECIWRKGWDDDLVRTTQWPMQIVLGLGALVLKGRTLDLGTWGRERG